MKKGKKSLKLPPCPYFLIGITVSGGHEEGNKHIEIITIEKKSIVRQKLSRNT